MKSPREFTLCLNVDGRILLLGCVIVVLALALSNPAGTAGVNAATTASVVTASGGGHYFYLTGANYPPSQALTACAGGYHMASFWELLDVSNLAYAYNHPNALTKQDSGHGPPSYEFGWVRTGEDSSGSNIVGQGNCHSWSANYGSSTGTAVGLSNTWVNDPGNVVPWVTLDFPCNVTGPVWCVSD